MKIAIPAAGKDLDSMTDSRFGRCPYFVILDVSEDKIDSYDAIENTATGAMRGAGVTASQIVVDQGVEVVISDNIGPRAFNALSQSGIKIFIVESMVSVKEAFEKFQKKELKEARDPTGPGFSR